MFKSICTSLLSLAALSLASVVPASATFVTIGVTAPAGYTATMFGPSITASTPGVWTASGSAGTTNASVAGVLVDPLTTSGYFGYAGGGGSVTATFASGITGLDFVWGSPDAYNTLTLKGPSGTEVYMPGVSPLITAAPVLASPVLFQSTPGSYWTSVTWSSTFNSFEFANVSTIAAASAAPEPSSIALLAGGLFAVAGLVRRKRVA